MSTSTPSIYVHTLHLPATAPQVRITAGLGTAAQKTWNLRRPVTLIGSRRPAHIVLHDGDISHAHCVIVNTGTEILLKDLHTSSGTLCNDTPIDLTLLKDGDVVTIGANKIQVAVQVPPNASDDSACGVTYSDPTELPKPLAVGLIHTDQQWSVIEAVALIGRHEGARIRLDHEEIANRHAVVFRFKDEPGIFDLGGRTGMLINGQRSSLAPLRDGDRVTVGPFGLRIGSSDKADLDLGAAVDETPHSPSATVNGPHNHDEPAGGPAQPFTAVTPESPRGPETGGSPVESEIESLHKNIAESWEHANSWQAQLLEDASALNKQESDLSARETELDAKDAALRGQLHDVTRYQEELTQRERDLAAQLAQLQAQKDEAAQIQTDCAKREEEIARRAKELARREHVVAQRWSRLLTATCPHCGRPTGTGEGSPNATAS